VKAKWRAEVPASGAALECGSLLPLSSRQLARGPRGFRGQEPASKLASPKRQQAAALQSCAEAGMANIRLTLQRVGLKSLALVRAMDNGADHETEH